jgi:hypothetical protein
MEKSFSEIYTEALAAGRKAGEAHRPVPMRVVQQANPFDAASPVVKDFGVYSDGVCGFAWVQFAGNTAFGRWAKRMGLARPAYPKGLSIWVSEYNQSMEKKDAHARAFAAVLNDYGIRAYPMSRMD